MATPDIYIGEEELLGVSPFRVTAAPDDAPSIDFDPGTASGASETRAPSIQINGPSEGSTEYLTLRGVVEGAEDGSSFAQPRIELREQTEDGTPSEGLTLRPNEIDLSDEESTTGGLTIRPNEIQMNLASLDGADEVSGSTLSGATVVGYERFKSGGAVLGPGNTDHTYEEGTIRVLNGAGVDGENFDAVRMRGGSADEQPRGGSVTVYDSEETDTVELLGSEASVRLGYSRQISTPFGNTFSGQRGRLFIDDGDRFGIRAEITADGGRFEIKTSLHGTVFQIDTGDGVIRTRYPVENTL